jgi:anti-sigma factor RsiW
MKCEEAEILLHALLDDELDAGHARDIETHVATCKRCAAQLRDYRDMRGAFAGVKLGYDAPADLRRRIDARLPALAVNPDRRSLLKGFAFGTGLSALAASAVVVAVMRNDQDSRIRAEIVSAHLRSLQADHLTDVVSTDQHTVKPWFNGKLDAAPPLADLTAQGFTLIGGRLDYVDGKAVAAIVYRRRIHVINLFVAQGAGGERHAAIETVQGFNVRRWSEQGFTLWAISDLNADELEEFGRKFEAAQKGGA